MANKYVDFKTVVWNRAHFNDDADMEKVKELLEKGASSNDICDLENGLGFTGEWETLLDSEMQLTPEQNEGIQTIEVFEDDEAIWDNSKKSDT